MHGLAGSGHSGYVRRLMREVVAQGWSALAVNLRGADGRGEDIYHAGLGSDLAVVLESVPGEGPVYLVGYSLGGHLMLRYLAGVCPEGGGREGAPVAPDARVRAAVAVCPPLDLVACVGLIDAPSARLYRRSLLRRLNKLYASVSDRRGVPEQARRARSARSIREWDERVVAPRFGFHGAEDYYRTVSVGPVLEGVPCPTLVVVARHDPMVPSSTLEPYLDANPRVETAWVERGGHVAIPRRALGLGRGSPERQLVDWLASNP